MCCFLTVGKKAIIYLASLVRQGRVEQDTWYTVFLECASSSVTLVQNIYLALSLMQDSDSRFRILFGPVHVCGALNRSDLSAVISIF